MSVSLTRVKTATTVNAATTAIVAMSIVVKTMSLQVSGKTSSPVALERGQSPALCNVA